MMEEDQDLNFFSRRVVPLMNELAAQINRETGYEVSFSVAGDNGGFFIHRHNYRSIGGDAYFWGLSATFHDTARKADVGKASLKLCGNYPESAEVGEGCDLIRSDIETVGGRHMVIAEMVRQAGLSLPSVPPVVAKANRLLPGAPTQA